MKIFISQPMKGKGSQQILNERDRLVRKVKELYPREEIEIIPSYFKGYNPAGGSIPLKFLAKSIELLADADVAAFAPDWAEARGCRVEHLCAETYGISIVEVEE